MRRIEIAKILPNESDFLAKYFFVESEWNFLISTHSKFEDSEFENSELDIWKRFWTLCK